MLKDWVSRHPVLTITLVSVFAVVINCYPIIFCGRSFVSPASVQSLVYDRWPPLPSMAPKEPFASQHGSDVGAMMWWDVPLGFLQSRSLLEQGQLPLWNRYSHTGAPLIGQAVSMLGDPLQLIVIFGRGSAAAWDLKFLTAKLLFCIGFGLVILRLMGNKPLAFIYAALGAYCGAFFFIANHPVFFVLAYAPWILVSAMELLDLGSTRKFRWWMIWLISNIGCFNGGHVEVAVDLIAGLNLAALTDAVARQYTTGQALKVLRRIAVATLLFLGLTAPVWTSFLVALDGAYTVHAEVNVVQHSLESLPGAFDDEFFRGISHLGPGTSLLVMAGVILSASNWRQFRQQTFFWVNSIALVVWGGCVFGWIPGSVLALIPLWNRVGHLSTDLSYLLVIHLTIQSAYGFKSLADASSFRTAAKGFLWIILIFLTVMWKYSFLLTSLPSRWYYFLYAGLGGIGAPLLYSYLKGEYRSIPALGWAGILLLGFVSQHRFGLYTFGDKSSLMVPGHRVQLDARSESIERLKAENSDPFRVVSFQHGCEGALSGDYSAVYGLEDVRSCSPIADGEYVKLMRHFPGMTFSHGWVIGVTNLVQAQPLLSLLNVTYVLSSLWEPPPTGSDFRVTHQSDFVVLENPQVWPRAFFLNKVALADSTEQFTKQLIENRRPFVCVTREEIEGHAGLRRLQTTTSPTFTPATNYKLLPNSTAFDIHAECAGVVCLTEAQARDFSVKVNKQPKEVLTVNRVFKGVYLDRPGDYEIVFTYRPHFWRYACTAFWISLATLVVLGARAASAAASARTMDTFSESKQ